MRLVRFAVAIVAVWGVAVALTLAVGATTTIGPTVYSVTKNHGIHLGDVVVGVLSGGAAAVVTALLVGVGIGSHLAQRREPVRRVERPLTRL